MRNRIKEFLELKTVLITELRDWVKDKSIPLDERWDIFIESKLGIQESYYQDFHPYLENYTINFDRHETAYSDDMVESLEYDLCEKEGVNNFDQLSDESKEVINDLKESILCNFMYSFENDW